MVIAQSLIGTFSFSLSVMDKIISIGDLSWMGFPHGTVVIGLTRLLIWLAIFTLFFALFTSVGSLSRIFQRNHATVISFCLATITAIFIPAQALLAMGSSWALLISALIIGLPLGGICYVLFSGLIPSDTRGQIFFKFVLVLLLGWILTAMKYHIGRLV